MPIDRSEVERIARLARLRIEPGEAEHLARDLERIVDYIDSLAEVELPADAESLTYFGRDVVRADRVGECLPAGEVLRNAPLEDGIYFLVPKILDREES